MTSPAFLFLPCSVFCWESIRAAVEKPKGPSRRSSRAEKEVEEETVADSAQRKRPARPGASTVVAAKGTHRHMYTVHTLPTEGTHSLTQLTLA
jgi:hypothetical protein